MAITDVHLAFGELQHICRRLVQYGSAVHVFVGIRYGLFLVCCNLCLYSHGYAVVDMTRHDMTCHDMGIAKTLIGGCTLLCWAENISQIRD